MFDILDALFAPLARLLVARGILFPDLVERMKAHYIAAARSLAGGTVTDSRLSVMTGLQRRDIARLKDYAAKPGRPNHLARLVALWQTKPGYHDAGGARPLPRTGPAPSFEALARVVRRDVHPRTMLDTLADAGTIRLDADEVVHLVETSYQPLAGSDEQIAYLARNMGDHMHAATENVLGRTPPWFERAVHYSDLTEAQVAELQSEYSVLQMQVLEELSRRAAEMKRAGKGRFRFRAGGYYYATGGDSA